MSHNVMTIEVRSARAVRIVPTIRELKEFIADAERAGIEDTVRVRVEKFGLRYTLDVEQRDESPRNAPVEENV